MIDMRALASGLSLGEDGIWYGASARDVSYPADGNAACFEVEEGSFWFRHRNACIAAIVKCFPPQDRGPIFDIGGGNGFVSRGLAEAGYEVVLIEPGRAGAANAKRRGLANVVCASTATAQLKAGVLPAVGLFDVIEHVQDDRDFLQSIRTLMRPGGTLYATVPAYPLLWSAEDILAGHFRRYSRATICAVLEAAGFRIQFASYIFRPLPLPILLLRALPYRLGLARPRDPAATNASDHAVGSERRQGLLARLLGREVAHLEQRRPMRFGGSCLVVAEAARTPA